MQAQCELPNYGGSCSLFDPTISQGRSCWRINGLRGRPLHMVSGQMCHTYHVETLWVESGAADRVARKNTEFPVTFEFQISDLYLFQYKYIQNIAWDICIQKCCLLFIWNSNITGFCVFLFDKSGNPTFSYSPLSKEPTLGNLSDTYAGTPASKKSLWARKTFH